MQISALFIQLRVVSPMAVWQMALCIIKSLYSVFFKKNAYVSNVRKESTVIS